ncbi:MAG TPA: glycosyltransferase family 39 protein, partial [Holophagaceae bacterium]|nr:glycosyltransferase family 39 protein [Holophagaceae bacterium]
MPEPSTTRSHPSEPAWALPAFHWGLLGLLVAIKLLIHGVTANSYGYFRDELYFLDCARHMSWGYVDDAPMIAAVFKVALWLGGSLPVIRMIAALIGAGRVALTMLLAREMGGRRFAQGLAGLCALVVPVFLGIDSILNVSGLECLFWMGCLLIIVRILRTGDSRLWLGAGLVAGLGLENKYSLLTFLLALLVAMLLTPLRRELAKRWFWLGAGLMLLVFLPTLLWQARHGFPLV